MRTDHGISRIELRGCTALGFDVMRWIDARNRYGRSRLVADIEMRDAMIVWLRDNWYGGSYPEIARIFGSDCHTGILESERRKRKRGDMGDTSRFEEFWMAYPRKIGKGAALRAWAKTLPLERDEIIRAAAAYAASPAGRKPGPGTTGDYRPHPATWLNSKRWEDDQTEWRRPNGGGLTEYQAPNDEIPTLRFG